jgi:hypothetical protein
MPLEKDGGEAAREVAGCWVVTLRLFRLEELTLAAYFILLPP